MITAMRQYQKSLQVALLIVVASFVASLFVFGTSGFTGGPKEQEIAAVNGEGIPVDRYQRRYQEYVNVYSQMFKDRFSPEMAERLGLSQQVVDDLVQEALVVQRARAEGLDVTDEELNEQIHAIPAFQDGGRFSIKRYDEILRRLGYAKAGFEQDMRRRLTRMKVEGTVKGAVKVSDGEVEQAYVHNHEQVRAAYALVDYAPLVAAATASDAEEAAYLKDHPAEFRQPERRRVQYVALNPRDFVKAPPQADVEKYYSEHASEFETPREAKVAHILVRVPDTGGSQAEDQARAKVADVIRRAKAGEDFAKLAREVSQDPGSARNGGDLGFIKKGEMVPPFEQVAFALRKGEVSPEPVRTPFGFHAIKVADIREGGKKPLGDVAAKIRERLQNEGADAAARARADEVRARLLSAKDFTAEAKKLGLAPVESTISRREGPRGLGGGDPLEEAAFGTAQGGVSAPVKTPAGYVVLKSVEHLPAAVPPLAEIKDKVAAAVKRQKAEATALERAKQIETDAKSGDLPAAAKKASATAGEVGPFSRQKPADRVPGDVMRAALGRPAGALTEPVKTQQGYYVLKVLERIPPDMSGLAKDRDQIAREVLSQKQGQAWETWLKTARARAKVEISSRLPSRRG